MVYEFESYMVYRVLTFYFLSSFQNKHINDIHVTVQQEREEKYHHYYYYYYYYYYY
jgi:hypothetical protein